MVSSTASASTASSSSLSSASSSSIEAGGGVPFARSLGVSDALIAKTRTCMAWSVPGALCLIPGLYLLVASTDDRHGSKSLHFVVGLLCLAATILILLLFMKKRMLDTGQRS